ncbi:MAG: hypothetical protein IKU08_06730 [Clostridia bacterium]|nr:hypothetical protein [Clostridia bacterium]
MANTKINVDAVVGQSSTASRVKTSVTNTRISFNATRNQIDSRILSRNNIANRCQNVYKSLNDVETKVSRIKSVVESGANRYHNTDQFVSRLSSNLTKNLYISNSSNGLSQTRSNALDMFKTSATNPKDISTNNSDSRSFFADFINNKIKVEGSVLSGEKSGSGEFLGIDTAGKISGAILTGEAGLKNKMNFKFIDDDGKLDFQSWGLSAIAFASGAVAAGEIEGNLGYLHGKASGKALTGSVEGNANFTIFDDGKFNPSVSVGAKASGSVLQGEAEAGFGTDQYGIYGKAEGDLLHAEAEAKAGIGYIGTDKKGNSIYGASAEASAMASVAQGEVKGGITLFGIDIDVGMKGYAVAAGVEAGGSISTKGVKANLSGALGLGAGLDIEVDWSDAEWIGDSIDAIGEFASDVADAAEDVGDFLFGWL